MYDFSPMLSATNSVSCWEKMKHFLKRHYSQLTAFTSLSLNHLHFSEEKKPTTHLSDHGKYVIYQKPATVSDIHQWYNITALSTPCNCEIHNHFPAKVSRVVGAHALGRAQQEGFSLLE